MKPETSLLDVLNLISDISHNRRLDFSGKLNRILLAIVACMQVKKGSIMLLKNPKTLEVVASTNPNIIGVCQTLDGETPSAWVVKHKKPLYVDSASGCDVMVGRFKHYKGDAFFLAPIIDHGRVIGVVNVTEKIGVDIFNEDERTVLLNIIGHVITALENGRLAASLKQKKKSLLKKNKELRRLQDLRTELFNMLIHDLKGPLSEIVANLDILSYTLTDENLDFVDTAKSGCDTLYNMVTNLLDIARLEEGKLPLMYEEIDPPELIKETLARLLVSGKSKQLRFAEQAADGDSGIIEGDRTLLVRILQNFLTNAIQYSPQGAEITVGYAFPKIGQVEFFVADRGPGVPELHQQAIFDKYMQLSKRNDGREYTTGLGLTFCKMAVEAHGGTIGVDSDGQNGSRFFFAIPSEEKRKRGKRGKK
ncbi:ATP-binding protein [Thermodesulfobacteriota bacterium]